MQHVIQVIDVESSGGDKTSPVHPSLVFADSQPPPTNLEIVTTEETPGTKAPKARDVHGCPELVVVTDKQSPITLPLQPLTESRPLQICCQKPPPAFPNQQLQPGYKQPTYALKPPSQCVGRNVSVLSGKPNPSGRAVRSGSAPCRGGSDSETTFLSSFDSTEIRSQFIRKVYTILSIQLLFTTAVIAVFIFQQDTKDFVRRYIGIFFVAFVIELTTYIALICCTNLRRNFPINLILLAIFTVSMAYIAGVISAYYDTMVVLYTFGITAAVCVLVSLIAIFSCVDITGCGCVLCILSLFLMVFGTVLIIVGLILQLPVLIVIYAGLAAALTCVYLMYDTQLIMGGRKIELSPEEYILGAICLYTDIINLFLMLLVVLNCIQGD